VSQQDGAQRRGQWEEQNLFFVEERQVTFVPSVFHLFDRNEMKSGRVNHVTLSGG
jgi:hypothetical protein